TVGETTLKIGTSAGGSQTATKDLTGTNKGPGTTGATGVDTGTYFFSETSPANYDTALVCFNDNGVGTGGHANDGIQNGTEPTLNPGTGDSLAVAQGDDIVCTFTNTRQRGSVELAKVWSGTAGQTTLDVGTA